MTELDKILNSLDIKPARPEPIDPANSMEIIDNLFKYFGEIFKNYEEKNGLPPFNGGPDKPSNNN